MKKNSGFTLVESLVATAILATVMIGALESFNRSFDAIAFAHNQYRYIMEAEAELNDLLFQSEKDFGTVLGLNNTDDNGKLHYVDANGRTYAWGKIYITNLHPGTTATTTYLLRAKAVICWKDKNRVFGEDQNLNGVLDIGEDINGNGEIDSPCYSETVLVRKD